MRYSTPLSRRRFLKRSAEATMALAAAPLSAHGTISPVQSATFLQDANGSSKSSPITRTVADWIVQSRAGDIPVNVRKEAVRSIVNSVGATVGGSADEAVTAALRVLGPYSGPPKASLFGRTLRLDPLNASLINGISSHVLDFDDTELNTIIHPAGVVACALFSLAADHPMTGAQFLHAFILGTEIECRLGNAIYPSHYDLGWHITATCGVFGAAAACGKVLGLDAQKMTWALGTAAVQAAGLKVVFGSMGKSFQVGRAAENGLLAALLAQQGFTSSDVPLEGVDGYFAAASRHHDDAQLTEHLGEHYEIITNTYKPFPCGIVIHPAIDAAIQLNKEFHFRPDDIVSVAVRANPLILKLTGKETPQTGLEGKFSAYHSVAIALIRGQVGLQEYTDAAVREPVVIALRGKVHITTDPTVRSDEVYMSLTTRDGHVYEKHIEHTIGSLQRPMTDADLEAKFLGLAHGVLPASQAKSLLTMCWKLESLPDVATIPKAGASRHA
jgi:2-methylcitrate dehydratase PrpD